MPVMLRVAPDDAFGRKLGRYTILCRIGAGGMAELYLAYTTGAAGFRKIVALKRFIPDVGENAEFLRMFLREAKITASLHHPNIAQVYDLGVDAGELYLVMEYVHGVTLRQVVTALRRHGHRLPIGFAAAVGRDVADALHYVHQVKAGGEVEQLVHRDVTEKNVMLTSDGCSKLLDFGIARSVATVSRTATGVVKGTPGYVSPEQLRGEPLSPRSDIFALGVVLYQILTDVRLFQGDTVVEQMEATMHQQIAPPSTINLDVPPALDAVILKALDRDPSRRHPTAQALSDAIEEACRGQLWRRAQMENLLARLFPERRDDWQRILALLPDDKGAQDAAGAALGALLARSKEETTPHLPPFASGAVEGDVSSGEADDTQLAAGPRITVGEEPTARLPPPSDAALPFAPVVQPAPDAAPTRSGRPKRRR